MDNQELIIKIFNSFNGKNLSELNQFYAQNVVFKDPVREVQGLDQLKKYYESAYQNVESIQFNFDQFIHNEGQYACYWVMEIQVKGLNSFKKYKVRGHSLIVFSKDNKVVLHEDFLDLGAMVYEKIPIVGQIIRRIKNKLKHT